MPQHLVRILDHGQEYQGEGNEDLKSQAQRSESIIVAFMVRPEIKYDKSLSLLCRYGGMRRGRVPINTFYEDIWLIVFSLIYVKETKIYFSHHRSEGCGIRMFWCATFDWEIL